MFTVLQRHVLTYTSHLQARIILVYKVCVLILGSQTLTCFYILCNNYVYSFTATCFDLHESSSGQNYISLQGFCAHSGIPDTYMFFIYYVTIMFTVLQRHVSTHTSHLQARIILVYKVTVLILGSQTFTCFLHTM